MKKKKNLFIILFILLIIGISCFIIKYIQEQGKITYKDKIQIKVGDNLPTINDYVNKDDIKKLKDTKISWNNIKIEKNKIYYAGIYSGTFNFRKKKKKIKLEVIDDIAPSIENVKNLEIYEKEKIDLLKNIETKDNSHDKIDIRVEGKYDINKKGEYNLKYIAIDKSNNKTEKDFKLIVKEKAIVSNNNTTSNLSTAKSSKGYKIEKINGIYYVNGILIANKTYSLPSTYSPGGLLANFTTNFNKMKNDALKANINLNIISGFRSYNTQARLYNNYVRKDGQSAADTYSARPGYSEHQTGLAADINSLEQSFINTNEGKWLNNNCHKYGFIIRYPKGKENVTGYMYEPWHIRYVGVDIATALYNNGNWLTLEEYLGITSRY